jgi:uncharacterized membrane protein
MRSLLLAVAVACGILAVCLTDPSGAQKLQQFNPRVCNQSGSEAQFAVIVRTAANMWRVRGWFFVDSGKCADLSPVLVPGFYLWAINEGGAVYQGDTGDPDTIWACLFQQKFDYDATHSPNCADDSKGAFIPVPAGKPVLLQ